ncbi:hypothetical protein LPJ81_006289 [Coemansia sp. IMI 209127]|nr:hypothetical protein LPJ81_006289 [Coemansia sp. IMI 209127]
MRTHRMTHNPDSVDARPHSCEHCPRTFTRKHDLVRHQVMHDSTGAFKCTVCSRAFARLDVLERHVRNKTGDQLKASKESDCLRLPDAFKGITVYM